LARGGYRVSLQTSSTTVNETRAAYRQLRPTT
jgi:hypothetical protein